MLEIAAGPKGGRGLDDSVHEGGFALACIVEMGTYNHLIPSIKR
jgi:hypothetical protein